MYRHLEHRLTHHMRPFLQRSLQIGLPQHRDRAASQGRDGRVCAAVLVRTGEEAAQGSAQDRRRNCCRHCRARGFREVRSCWRGIHQRPAERAQLLRLGGRPHDENTAGAAAVRARFWSSTPASIPTRPRTSGICATRSWATRSCACCAPPDTQSMCRTTSTTPACRLRMWSSAFVHLEKQSKAEIEQLAPASPHSTTTAGTSMRGCRSGTSRTRQNLQGSLADAACHRAGRQ